MALSSKLNDPSPAGTIPATPAAAAAPTKLRREMAGAATPVLFTKFSFMSRSRSAYHALNLLLRPTVRIASSILISSLRRLAKLEHQDGASLRHVGLRPLNLVDAVLKASRVKVPACSDCNILFPVDLEGRGNADRARGQREAPQLIAGTRVKRSEQSIRSSTSEENVAARDQKGGPKNTFEIVLPYSLAGVQIPGLELSQVIGSASAGTDRSENAVDVIPHIKPLRI